MIKLKKSCITLILATSLGFGGLAINSLVPTQLYAQTSVAVIVDGNAITNYDIQRRAAFLKLQQKSGNVNATAKQELIDEMLKRVEMKRRNMSVDPAEVNNAFAGFAERNHMSVAQMSEMLNKAGVTPEHFKTYIGTQMGWGRLVSARYRAEGGMVSEQDAVQRMIKNGGVKPTTNEYSLKQVIFVIPANRRSAIFGKRKQDADRFRAQFKNCSNLNNQAKGTIDVTVRDLGRVLEPQLPEEWSKAVRATPVGKMTPAHETARGIETLAVCEIKKVSDDRVAQLVFSIEDNKKAGDKKAEDLSENYLKELRNKARIKNP